MKQEDQMLKVSSNMEIMTPRDEDGVRPPIDKIIFGSNLGKWQNINDNKAL